MQNVPLDLSSQITHVWRDKHRQQLFRGWSRLCLHAASLNAAEGDSAAATAVARATRVETIGNEADAAAARVKTATATTPSEKEMQEVSGVSTLAGALQERVKVAERAARQEQERRAILVVSTTDSAACGVGNVGGGWHVQLQNRRLQNVLFQFRTDR